MESRLDHITWAKFSYPKEFSVSKIRWSMGLSAIVILTSVAIRCDFGACLMAPELESFHCSELLEHIHTLPNGKRRKGPAINLNDCELMELVQYECRLKGKPKSAESVIQCFPLTKLFRR